MFKKTKKDIDFSDFICYNIEVAWRDGRVVLRRTTGNRVYHNRYHGFESHSLRHNKNTPYEGCSYYFMAVRVQESNTARSAMGSHTPPEDRRACSAGAGRVYLHR